MDKTFKVVFSVIVLYALIGINNLFNYGAFIVPYELNPVILSFTALVVFFFNRQSKSKNYDLVYFLGVLIYGLCSERFLKNLSYWLSLKSKNNFYYLIEDIANSPYTGLVSILSFYIAVLLIFGKVYLTKNPLKIMTWVILILSFVVSLFNFSGASMFIFNTFVILNVLLIHWKFNDGVYNKISSVSYQLLLFVFLENTYYFLSVNA